METKKPASPSQININGTTYNYSSLKNLPGGAVDHHPFTIQIDLKNVSRNYDGFSITDEHINALRHWSPEPAEMDMPFKPSRILMQEFTGVPTVVDIAALRSGYVRQGGDGQKINPAIPVDMISDHSVQDDYYVTDYSDEKNVEMEDSRKRER